MREVARYPGFGVELFDALHKGLRGGVPKGDAEFPPPLAQDWRTGNELGLREAAARVGLPR